MVVSDRERRSPGVIITSVVWQNDQGCFSSTRVSECEYGRDEAVSKKLKYVINEVQKPAFKNHDIMVI